MQDIVEAVPDVLVIAPCGYDADQARHEYCAMSFPEQWNAIPAVRDNRVYALAANSYFSRPGPRLAAGVEILAQALHPECAWAPVSAGSLRALPVEGPKSATVGSGR
jgi:iron complex transport system substrate-binding protein